MNTIPAWLHDVEYGARTISAHELTRFLPPEDTETRLGAVLMLFGGETAQEGYLLLTERAHTMRSHPGQISFPGGSLDPGEDALAAALREAEEETGLDPAGIEVFAELPALYLPPSNFSVTPILGYWREPVPLEVVNPEEVHAVYLEPIAELLDPEHRISVRAPNGWVGPGFGMGPNKDLLLWGFTAGIIARLFDHLGWTRPWDQTRMRDLPEHMLRGGEVRRPHRYREDPRYRERS